MNKIKHWDVVTSHKCCIAKFSQVILFGAIIQTIKNLYQFGAFGVTISLLSIPTHRTFKLTPQDVLKPSSDLGEEDKTKKFTQTNFPLYSTIFFSC